MGDAFGPGSRAAHEAAGASSPSRASIPIAEEREHLPLDGQPQGPWEYGINYGARRIRGFMCKVDWDHEIGSTSATIYPSIEDLRRERSCVEQCGIVEVETTLFRIIQRTDFKREAPAQGIEARRAETGTGSVHESPVGNADAPKPSSKQTEPSAALDPIA